MSGNGEEDRIRILIADSDEDYRNTMRAILATEQDFDIIGMAGDGERAARLAAQLQPDVAILDVSMPRLDGIAAAENIGVSAPYCQTILVSDSNDIETMRRCMLAGAREYLVKPVEAEDLVRAIRRLREMEEKRRTAFQGVPSQDRAVPPPARQRTSRVIVIWGPKGGVGRTFIAVNLALSLASDHKRRVLLIDGSLEFGNVDVAMDIEVTKSIIDLLVDSEDDLDPDLIARVVNHHSSGLDVLMAPPAEALYLVLPMHVQRILSIMRRLYDFIVIDTRPSLDEATLAFLDLADAIVAVATPELTALRNMRVFLDAARRLGYSADKIRLVINRADMRGAIALADIEKATRRPVALTISNDHEAVAGSINHGRPVVLHMPQRPVAREIARLANLAAHGEIQTEAVRTQPRGITVSRLFARPAGH